MLFVQKSQGTSMRFVWLGIRAFVLFCRIGVHGVDEEFHNPCAHVIKVSTFFARKWLLIKYSSGFVLFPGGIGTVDELFEVLNAMKLSRLQRVPIILVGKEYWQPLFTWL